MSTPMDFREWAQNSADGDGRRWLAARLPDLDAYAAACTLADLGPAGSDTTRQDREGAVRELVRYHAREAERLRGERDAARAKAKEWRDESGWGDLLPWEDGGS